MNFLDWNGTKTSYPVRPYLNDHGGNFINNNNQFISLGPEFETFKDTPLTNIYEMFHLLMSRIEKQYQMNLLIFFKNIQQLHSNYLEKCEQLKQMQDIQNANIQPIVNESGNNQQFDNFRDYLLFHSSNRETKEVLFSIEQYTDQKVRDYLQLKSKVLSKSEWAQFVAELTGERESVVCTPNCAAIKRYVIDKCKENPAIRSGNVDEVIYNIIRLRNLQ